MKRHTGKCQRCLLEYDFCDQCNILESWSARYCTLVCWEASSEYADLQKRFQALKQAISVETLQELAKLVASPISPELMQWVTENTPSKAAFEDIGVYTNRAN